MYVTCVIPIEKRIVILETAADLSLYGTYKDRILACWGPSPCVEYVRSGKR
jgi:hypothetical protein